ncbi:hypothetical protein JCM5353_007870 [Sporobolomyces roseus]
MDNNGQLSEALLQILAQLITLGFSKIADITDPVHPSAPHRPIYVLPYSCTRDDIVVHHQAFRMRDGQQVWHLDIPAMSMQGCHDTSSQVLVPWMACPIATDHAQYPGFRFSTMAGPRGAGILGRANRPQTTPGMQAFHDAGYRQGAGINVKVDGYHYVHELTLDQQYIVPPLMTLYSGNQPPQEVIYEARYRFYPRGNRDAFMRERHFELKAKLNHRNRPHLVQARTTQAPEILITQHPDNGPNLDYLPFH